VQVRPRTYLTVGGADLYERFGMAVTDGFELSPPEPVTHTVDVPGRNGALDLTEALSGDVTFSNRKMAFELLWVGDAMAGFEAAKTALSNYLHGRRLAFTWSLDPGYEYTGRFSLTGYSSGIDYGTVSLEVDADPYKIKGPMSASLEAPGGTAALSCGRMPCVPTITTSGTATVSADGYGPEEFPAGTHRVRGLVLRQGDNDVTVECTQPVELSWEWGDL
jgi:hypothetical protein